MSLFHSSRTGHRSAEYSTVEADQSYDVVEVVGGHDALGHDQGNRPSVEVSDLDGNTSHRSTLINSESSHASNDNAPKTYAGPAIEGWPTAPRQLRGFSVPLLIGDMLLILLPVAFLVLGISAWQLNGKKLSSHGRVVERAMSIGPTVYPLAFAAIGSRCLRSIAVRLAERGTTILTLERLLGSQSLVSAIGTACSLRSANFISICLLLLWVLSPLGGQSSLRLLHQANSTVVENGTIYYSNPAAPIDLDEAGNWLAVVPTILTASLSTSLEAKARPIDSWGHPKVPRLDVIEQQAISDPYSKGNWVNVSSNKNHTYSSWAGINVQNLRQSEQAVFEVKYNYMYLECPNPSIDTPENTLDGLFASDIATFPQLVRASANESAYDTFSNISIAGSDVSGVSTQSFFLRAAYTLNSTQKTPNMTTPFFNLTREPISFLYGLSFTAREDDNDDLSFSTAFVMYTCSPHIVTVDAQVECQGSDCSVTRLRHIPSEPVSSLEEACDTGPFHRLGCMTNATYTVFQFLRYFPTSVASLFTGKNPTTSNAFTNWLTGSDNPYTTGQDLSRNTITDQEKVNRLTTLLNTYFQGGSWGYQVTRAGFFDKPEYPWAGDWDSRSPDRWISASDAVFSHPVPVYRADVGWVISLLLITLVLLLLGIVNVAYSFITIAPDLFYYASSLARENPYTDTPDGGTAMDGAERSRLLKKMRVQIADVSPKSQIGYVVVKSVEDKDGFHTGRLKKGRMYW